MQKHRKLFSAVLAMLVVLGMGYMSASAADFKHPSWTSVNSDGTVSELPTFEEAYAYLDYDSAPADVKNLILEARRHIVFGKDSWTVNGCVSIKNADGTVEKLPEFKDLYPDWDLKQLSYKDDAKNPDNFISRAANFFGNVYIPKEDSEHNGNEFYTFNSAHTYTDTWADTLPGDRFNVGYRDADSNTNIGYIANLKEGQSAHLTYDTGVRIAVRCSTDDKPGQGFLNVVGYN